jgi:hypothetical protein
MKLLFTGLFMLLSTFSFSQQKYPIQTIYKNSPVVIITLEQSIQINKFIDDQNIKINYLEDISSKNRIENDKLINKVSSMSDIIDSMNKRIDYLSDSLCSEHNRYLIALDNRDTATSYANSLVNWIIYAAIDNTFIYLDWSTYSVKIIDFNTYKTKKNIFGKYEFKHLNVVDSIYREERVKNKIVPTDLDKMDITDCPIKIKSIRWSE